MKRMLGMFYLECKSEGKSRDDGRDAFVGCPFFPTFTMTFIVAFVPAYRAWGLSWMSNSEISMTMHKGDI